MKTTAVEFIGIAAGLMTTLSFLPQVIRTVRTRSVRDLSLGMVLLFFSGIVLWLVYGTLIRAWPIIAANAVTLVLVFILLVCVLKYRRSAE